MPGTQSVDATNIKIHTVVVPAWAGRGNFFSRIPGLDKSFGATYWKIFKNDGQGGVAAVVFVLGVAAAPFLPGEIVLPIFAFLLRFVRYFLRDRRAARRPAHADTRPFTLYLRPFVSDARTASSWGISRFRDAPLTMALGPNVQAVGSPRDKLPLNLGLNVTLAHLSNESWQTAVTDSIERAKFIWIHCGPQEWVQWEIRRVFESRRLSSVAFVLPTENKQHVWDLALSNAPEGVPEIECLKRLDVSNVMIVCFKTSDTMVVVKGERDSPDDYLPAIYAARYSMLAEFNFRGTSSDSRCC